MATPAASLICRNVRCVKKGAHVASRAGSQPWQSELRILLRARCLTSMSSKVVVRRPPITTRTRRAVAATSSFRCIDVRDGALGGEVQDPRRFHTVMISTAQRRRFVAQAVRPWAPGKEHSSAPQGRAAATAETSHRALVAAAAAAVMAVGLCASDARVKEAEGNMCLCKSKASAADSLEDHSRRLQRLSSLGDIFDEYATVTPEGVGKLMTCGDFLRAMLCYRYVWVSERELKRRCARYLNPLLGDIHGLISFDEFCFLLSLVAIPAGLFDVAFAAADGDGSGTIDVGELETLVKRLAPADKAKDLGDVSSAADDGGDSTERLSQLTGHKRLSAAWFGEDGKGSVPREQFAAFVRDLRRDVKTVECRLYSRVDYSPDEPEQAAKQEAGGLRWWWPPSWIRRAGGHMEPDSISEAGEIGDGLGGGWWNRYEHEMISVADLALTLVSSCHPRDMPRMLARAQAVRKKRSQVPLRDALLLHEVLEDHAEDLDDALGLYSKVSSGSVGMAEFAHAARIVSGKELSPECVWVVFQMFDSNGDGKLEHAEVLEATHDNHRRLPGSREAPNKLARFVHCVRGS